MYPKTSIFADIARNVVFAWLFGIFLGLQALIYPYILTLQQVIVPAAEMLRKRAKDNPFASYLLYLLLAPNRAPCELVVAVRSSWRDFAENNFSAMCKDLFELERVIMIEEGFCFYEILFLIVLQFRQYIFVLLLKINETFLSLEEAILIYITKYGVYQVPKKKDVVEMK